MNDATHTGSSFLHPENILAKAGLAPGKTVVDIGCGGGYFVIAAARIVGDEGMVYGIDILKGALSSVNSKARMDGLSNVTTIWSDVEVAGGAKEIRNRSVDYVLLIQLLSQTTDHKAILEKVDRIIKEHGTVVVVDWQKNNLNIGPTEQSLIPPDTIKSLFVEAHYSFRREIETGPYHFGLIFEKK